MPTIDFFEKEVKRLQDRFNETLGVESMANPQARALAILAICRAGMRARSVRDPRNEKESRKISEDFFCLRGVLNGIFDRIESQLERRTHEKDQGKKSASAGR